MTNLTRDTRCACCGEPMKAGEPFRWHLKSGIQGGSRAGGTNDRYRPAHPSLTCYLDKVTAARKAKEAHAHAATRKMIAEMAPGLLPIFDAAAAASLNTRTLSAMQE